MTACQQEGEEIAMHLPDLTKRQSFSAELILIEHKFDFRVFRPAFMKQFAVILQSALKLIFIPLHRDWSGAEELSEHTGEAAALASSWPRAISFTQKPSNVTVYTTDNVSLYWLYCHIDRYVRQTDRQIDK